MPPNRGRPRFYVVQFGQEEDQRLSNKMQPRDISVAEDETFHPQPDLFHVQHETVKATGFALAGQVERAEKQLEQTRLRLEQTRQVLAACTDSYPQSDYRYQLQQQRNQAETALVAAEQDLEACRDRRQRAAEADEG